MEDERQREQGRVFQSNGATQKRAYRSKATRRASADERSWRDGAESWRRSDETGPGQYGHCGDQHGVSFGEGTEDADTEEGQASKENVATSNVLFLSKGTKNNDTEQVPMSPSET